jgi:hypothetical protein
LGTVSTRSVKPRSLEDAVRSSLTGYPFTSVVEPLTG